MDINLINKIDELINVFENSEQIQELTKLKEDILKDQDIKKKIEHFNIIKDNIHSSELINIRKELLQNKKIKKYKEIENELLLLTFAINQKLNSLTNEKRCINENN